MRLINIMVLDYRYWPEAEQCFWLKGTYHYILAQCCVHAACDSHLLGAMMNYNLLDILRIQSFENRAGEFKSNYKSHIDYFSLLGNNILCFQRTRVSEWTNEPWILPYPFYRLSKAPISMVAFYTNFISSFDPNWKHGHLRVLGL